MANRTFCEDVARVFSEIPLAAVSTPDDIAASFERLSVEQSGDDRFPKALKALKSLKKTSPDIFQELEKVCSARCLVLGSVCSPSFWLLPSTSFTSSPTVSLSSRRRRRWRTHWSFCGNSPQRIGPERLSTRTTSKMSLRWASSRRCSRRSEYLWFSCLFVLVLTFLRVLSGNTRRPSSWDPLTSSNFYFFLFYFFFFFLLVFLFFLSWH